MPCQTVLSLATRMNAQGWAADHHLFCNEHSSRTKSDTFCCVVTHPSAAPVVTVSCASRNAWLCRRLHGRSFVSQNSLSRMAK